MGTGFNIYSSTFDEATQSWGEPAWMGENVNPGSYPTISGDGQTLYFVRSRSVYVSTYVDGDWTAAVEAPFPINDGDPNSKDGPVALTPDGLTMFVASQRDGGYGSTDIWRLTWDGSQWTNPTNCGPGVNTTAVETHPSVSPDGTRLFFSDFGGDRPGLDYGGVCLFYSDWTGTEWGEAAVFPAPVNSDLPICSAHLVADGKLYLGSEVSEGGRGEEDIWVTMEGEGRFDPGLRESRTEGWFNTGDLDGAWYVYDLAESGDAIYAATAPHGVVFRSRNAGASWEKTTLLPNVDRTYSLLAAGDGSLYAGTYPEGKVFHTTDEGVSWDELPAIPEATAVRSLEETTTGAILAATSPDSSDVPLRAGRVFRITPGDPAWERLGLLEEIASGVFTVYEADPGVYFAGGRCYGDKFYVSPNNGASWIRADLPYDDAHVSVATLYFFFRDSDDRLWTGGWAHGPQGILLSSTDDGFTWDTTGVLQQNGDVIVGRVFDMAESDDGGFFIGVHPGPDQVVLRSTDGGATWGAAGSLLGANEALCLMKSSDGDIYAGTTPNGDVYRWRSSDDSSDTESTDLLKIISYTTGPEARIRYSLPAAGLARLTLHDVAGRLIAILLEREESAGEHTVPWAAVDLAQGVHFLRLESRGHRVGRKVAIVR